jgi:branched-chain amino acid transport system permease protein
MEFWITQIFYGLSYASVLFLFASGLTLIFGVMRIINLVQGSFYLLGGYICYTVIRVTQSYLAGMLAAMIVIAMTGLVLEKVFIRKVYGNNLGQVLLTAGFAFVFQDVAFLIWGGDPYTLQVPEIFSGSLVVGNLFFPRYRMFMLAIAVLIGAGLWVFEKKTRAGAIIRAAVDHEQMARGVGINVNKVSMGVYALGAGITAIGGVVGAGFLGIYPGMDFETLPYGFVIVILGGRGSLEGAMIGSIIVGLVDNFGKVFFPELSYFTLFVPMILMLAIRPRGLFGKA